MSKPPLTQPEIDALPDGTGVIVTWSGGNGPHRYTISRRHGYTAAFGFGIEVGALNICGEHPLTQVWLVPADQ